VNALKQKILKRIAAEGPISVAHYMSMCLNDPAHGYYTTHDPFGRAGDFVTAPEVSQMFGEVVGLWFVQAWLDHGMPEAFDLVELGPGRGTLMADMLRAAKVRPEFLKAAHVTLVETSPHLREMQKAKLQNAGIEIRWENLFTAIPPDNPLYLMANEFLDALPIIQLEKTKSGWRERKIAAQQDDLVFSLDENPSEHIAPARFRDAPPHSIFEFSPAQHALVAGVASRIAAHGGAALIIDYGHEHSGLGDTFQAVKAHTFADPLAEPGEADLTAHVDFEALAAIAKANGAKVFGPVTQKTFLESLGVRARAEKLGQQREAERLTSPKEMGMLFKVMALCEP